MRRVHVKLEDDVIHIMFSARKVSSRDFAVEVLTDLRARATAPEDKRRITRVINIIANIHK